MSNEKIKVFVVCMTYNHENYIRSALEGFLTQKTNFKFKVLVHDDASTDRTQEIISEYAKRKPDIIVPILQKENNYQRGISSYKTEIFPRLEGDYVAICEGDDYWTDENKLQKQVDFLDSHPDYVACVHNCIKLDMRTMEKSLFNQKKTQDGEIVLKDVVFGNWGVYQTASLMCRINNFKNEPDYFKLVNVGDYPRALQLTTEGRMWYMADVMSIYRFASGKDSWTNKHFASKYNFEKNSKSAKMEADMLSRLLDLYPERKEDILPAISAKRYDYMFLSGNISMIKKDDYLQEIYRKESLFRKFKAHLLHLYFAFMGGKRS